MTDLDLQFVDVLLAETAAKEGGARAGRSAVIPILHALQEHYGYLPQEALRRVCEGSDIRPADVEGVSTFYDHFRHNPVGKYLIRVCHGTACHVKGAAGVHEAFLRHLQVPAGADTDAQGLFTVQKVACLGCCTLAPAVQIGQVTYGHLTPERVASVLRDFLELERLRARRKPASARTSDGEVGEIRVGLGSCCVARGSGDVKAALERALAALKVKVRLERVGCVGMCHQTPLLEVLRPDEPPALYARVEAADVRDIVLRHFRPPPLKRAALALSRGLERLLTDEGSSPVTRYSLNVREDEVASFLGPQRHLATERCGQIDPLDLEEYVAGGGFAALRDCLGGRQPQEIIHEVASSGLRGRGGAGYATGLKWQHVHDAPGPAKYVVCNGDEGDPGAFMDRMLLESYPYRVIEGMAIAAHAVGAKQGYLYIRAEYPLAVERTAEALRRCYERGIFRRATSGALAANDAAMAPGVPTAPMDLDLRIMQGAGAFVCGEETALLASIEGRRGTPRPRPPYPAQSGLWGRPTLVNNVETYALVGWILRQGPERFAELGTGKSAGTKVFALAGKVARGGLIEVPMGVTIRQIVMDIGGGIAGGRKFKAVQIGGPSGGCIPERLSDTPVDYEALTHLGAIMGSGGIVVLDETDCMVDIARYFLEFTQNQSCGRCTFCRIGTRRMLEILRRLCEGHGQKQDLQQLADLARGVKRNSLCGLGRTAPNPVLTTLEHFAPEYHAHLAGRCPAGVCKALIRYEITDDCIGCTLCAQHCPVDAIAMTPFEKHTVDDAKCTRCGTCRTICPAKAVKVV